MIGSAAGQYSRPLTPRRPARRTTPNFHGDRCIATRLLIPKEHGAYGQLLIPLLTALLVGRPAPGAWLLAASATAVFFAHEGVLVLLGQRGVRASREQRASAMRSVSLFGGFSLVTGLVGLSILRSDALIWLLLPVSLAAGVAVAVFMHLERTTPGELLVAAALSSMSVPVTLAGETRLGQALTVFAVFAVVFVAATLSVRALIGRTHKGSGPPPLVAAALTLVGIVLLAWLSLAGRLAPVAPFATLPVCAVAVGLVIAPPGPRYLREIGWTFVGATLLTAAVLVLGLR